jgi:hypothetical protein
MLLARHGHADTNEKHRGLCQSSRPPYLAHMQHVHLLQSRDDSRADALRQHLPHRERHALGPAGLEGAPVAQESRHGLAEGAVGVQGVDGGGQRRGTRHSSSVCLLLLDREGVSQAVRHQHIHLQ